MAKTSVRLVNTVYWDSSSLGNKLYMEEAQLALIRFPFATRAVFLRFADGPSLDLAIEDMDRLVAAYSALRAQTEVPIVGHDA